MILHRISLTQLKLTEGTIKKTQTISNGWKSKTSAGFFFGFQSFLPAKFTGKQNCLSVTTDNSFWKISLFVILGKHPEKIQ